MQKEPIDSYRVMGDMACIVNELLDAGVLKDSRYHRCESSDATSAYLSEFPDGSTKTSTYCFSCNQAVQHEALIKSSYASEFGYEDGILKEKKTFEKKDKKERITKAEMKEVISHGYEGKGYRGLKDKYLQFFGHIVKKNYKNEPHTIYYPETRDGKLYGYKSRVLPKFFGYDNKGITGIKNDLAGQVKFKEVHGRDLLIVGGEVDLVSAFQMFSEYQEKRFGNSDQEYVPMPVVSPTTGESSALKQIREQYDFINRFDNIYLGLDNDETGREAMEAIAEIFPKEKVKIIYWSMKDPNSFLYNKEGKDYSAQFIRDFYNAKPYVNMGIVTSSEADSLIEEELLRPKMQLPDFMQDLQKKMAGGIPLGYIVNFIAETGIGKSTLVNEVIRKIIYDAPYKVGILSLELTAAQYMIAMLSREIGYKLNLIENPQEAVEFVRKPEVMVAREKLTKNEYGEARFVLLDERDGDLEEVKMQCELLVNKYGCQVLIIDPIQDLFEGVGVDAQNAFVKWMKVMLKKGVTFLNVCHVRKGNHSTDKEGKRILRELTEDDVHGISAIVKSGGANLFMSRNKYADHYIEKNTTYPSLGKCRWTGHTGKVDSWYYDNNSHTMYDLYQFFENNLEELGDYDLENNPFDKKKSSNTNSASRNAPREVIPVDTFGIDVGEDTAPF